MRQDPWVYYCGQSSILIRFVFRDCFYTLYRGGWLLPPPHGAAHVGTEQQHRLAECHTQDVVDQAETFVTIPR